MSFRYRRGDWVFKDFSLAFPAGSTVLLGPNGAGKSTLLSLGASVLRPRRGSVRFDDLAYMGLGARATYRRRVGWMPQRIRPIPGFSVREQVAYVAWLKGMRRRESWAAAVEALETAGLARQMDQKASELSGGQLQRLGVSQAIVHSAKLLLMDEPTAGLDPEQRARFRELILKARAHANLVISTHQTEDILDSYDSVVVLSEGQILFTGSVREFLAHAPSDAREGRKAEAAYVRILSDRGRLSA